MTTPVKIDKEFWRFIDSAHFDEELFEKHRLLDLNGAKWITSIFFDGDCQIDLIETATGLTWSITIGNSEELFEFPRLVEAIIYLYENWYLPEIVGSSR